MKSLDNIISNITELVGEETNIDKELLHYGLESLIIHILNIASILIIGLILNIFVQCILFLVIFSPLRVYAGEAEEKQNNSLQYEEVQQKNFDFTDKKDYQIVNKEYDKNGELIKFSVINSNKYMETKYNFSSYTGPSRIASDVGVYQFITGMCIVVEVFSGYSCIDIAREVGLKYINGTYYFGVNPYSGTWRVTYGYIPGCQPQHSGGCYGATFEKI